MKLNNNLSWMVTKNLLTVFAKRFILDVCQGSEDASR